jgi:NAD(P)H dehydrogenase (quinone)
MESVIHKSARTLIQVGEALGIHNLDPESGKIFVTGGTGVVGHRVAARLLNAGYPSVRLGTKNPESLADMNKLGAEIADFSWDREETYEKALKDVRSVLCTIPYTKMWYKHFPVFLEACKAAGVKHIVKISFYHARVAFDRFQEVPLVREHGDCDDELIRMIKPDAHIVPVMGPDMTDIGMDLLRPNMSYTILYASHFMSNPFTFQGQELRNETNKPCSMYGASGNRGVNYVSPNDVAEMAVRVLVAPQEHYNKEYTLTGPEAITDQQVADLLSKYLRKPIMYVDQPLHEFTREIKVSGEPKWMVADMASLEKIKATGTEEDHAFRSDDIERICGHPPETFEEYLRGTDMMTKVEAGPPSELKPLRSTMSA